MSDTTDRALDALQAALLEYANGEHDMTPVGAELLQAHEAITALRAQLAKAQNEAARDRMILQAVKAYVAGEPSRPPVTGMPKRALIDQPTPSAPSPEATNWRNHSTKTEDGYNG